MVPCPTCKKEVAYSNDNQFRPFCSKRCRLIDLGAWLEEGYSIPAAEDGREEGDDNSQ
jgi:endogenous inhibitor of DNA gyrase (YacG/DUF329 family)